MPIVRRPRHDHYVRIDHDTIRDRRLSWKARGLLAYLLSLPDDWEISFQELTTQSPHDKVTALRSAFKELLSTGYAVLHVVRNTEGTHSKGKRYIVGDHPLSEDARADSEDTDVYDTRESQETSKSGNLTFRKPESQETYPIKKDREEKNDREETNKPHNTKTRVVVAAQEALDYLNAQTGRRYRDASYILARLRGGATVEECRLVIDWWKAVNVPKNPKQEQYFTNVTPFRPDNFDTYRAAAEQWDAQGRVTTPTPHPSTPASHAALLAWIAEEDTDETQ